MFVSSIVLILDYYSIFKIGGFKIENNFIVFLNIVIIGALAEEFIYRGLFMNILIKKDEKKHLFYNLFVISIISMLFAIFHFQYNLNFIFHFLFSFFVTYIYYKKRDFFQIALMHILFNFYGEVDIISMFGLNKLNLFEILLSATLSSIILFFIIFKYIRE